LTSRCHDAERLVRREQNLRTPPLDICLKPTVKLLVFFKNTVFSFR
jgi:hypothetical protein